MELDKIKRTWVEVDLDAIEHNFKAIKSHIGETKICCVVKADGYGHGAKVLSKLYENLGADYLAVSNIDEAEEHSDGKIFSYTERFKYGCRTACIQLEKQSYCPLVCAHTSWLSSG